MPNPVSKATHQTRFGITSKELQLSKTLLDEKDVLMKKVAKRKVDDKCEISVTPNKRYSDGSRFARFVLIKQMVDTLEVIRVQKELYPEYESLLAKCEPPLNAILKKLTVPSKK